MRLAPLVLAALLGHALLAQAPPALHWKQWLGEDARYIITDEERRSFKSLKTDEERDIFVQQFWQRRDPTPDTEENEYKEEHYRRIAYADEQFALPRVPGWKTDQGMLYIKYGPPDAIEAKPGTLSWHYRLIDGVGTDVVIDLEDRVKDGNYSITVDPHGPAGLYKPLSPQSCMHESMRANDQKTVCMKFPADGLARSGASMRTPPPKFKNLAKMVASGGRKEPALPVQVRVDFLRLTNDTIDVNLLLDFPTSAFANINFYGRLINTNHQTVTWFENSVSRGKWHAQQLLLPPGTYRLQIAANNEPAIFDQELIVPSFDEGSVSASSIILADRMNHIPADSPGPSNLQIRTTEINRRFNNVFKQNETLGFYAEFYNFAPDEGGRPQGRIEYEIISDQNGEPVLTDSEDVANLKGSRFLVVIEKKFPLSALPPGAYTLKITAIDTLGNQTLTPLARFTVTL